MVAIIFFPSGRPHLANHPHPTVPAFIHFCLTPLPPPHPNVRTSFMDDPNSKKFRATVKPHFSNISTECITLEENRKMISNYKELAWNFNEFFVNIVPNLGINTNHSFLINTDNENDPIKKAIADYKNHHSIISIRTFMENSDFFLSNMFQKIKSQKQSKS